MSVLSQLIRSYTLDLFLKKRMFMILVVPRDRRMSSYYTLSQIFLVKVRLGLSFYL